MRHVDGFQDVAAAEFMPAAREQPLTPPITQHPFGRSNYTRE